MKSELMGKRVKFSSMLKEVTSYERGDDGNHKFFVRTNTVVPCDEKTEKTGWIVGFRTTSDRRIPFSAYNAPERGVMMRDILSKMNRFNWVNYVLVAESPHKNAVRVPLDGYELID